MNVLSLFDGMSCAQIALDRMSIKVDNYFASEIDKHAIKETKANYKNTIHIGDVRSVDGASLPPIDLLVGGSPCQGFSYSGKRLNFDDPRSRLFFEFVRVLKECRVKNPSLYFLLENVKMKPEWADIITKELRVEPIEINSSLVSAQNRVRLYWTNIPNSGQPMDLNIGLGDILESDRDYNKATILGRRLDSRGKRQDYNKDIPITQCLEVRGSNQNKSNCLTTVKKDNVLTPLAVGRYPDAFKNKLLFRYYTLTECCRLQTVPEDYFKYSSDNQARKMLGNGWTINVITHLLKHLKR